MRTDSVPAQLHGVQHDEFHRRISTLVDLIVVERGEVPVLHSVFIVSSFHTLSRSIACYLYSVCGARKQPTTVCSWPCTILAPAHCPCGRDYRRSSAKERPCPCRRSRTLSVIDFMLNTRDYKSASVLLISKSARSMPILRRY